MLNNLLLLPGYQLIFIIVVVYSHLFDGAMTWSGFWTWMRLRGSLMFCTSIRLIIHECGVGMGTCDTTITTFRVVVTVLPPLFRDNDDDANADYHHVPR